MMVGCCNLKTQSNQPIPQLDESLAKPCEAITVPLNDFDDWRNWIVTDVLPKYGRCGIDKNKIVQEWNKLADKAKQK